RLWRHYPRWPAVTRLFRTEARPLDEADPVRLAEFFALLLSKAEGHGGGWRVVMRSVPLDTWPEPDWDPAPTLTGNHASGWFLRFATTQSFLSRYRDARLELVQFSPDFSIRMDERRLGSEAHVMSEALFDRDWRHLFPGRDPP